MMAPTRSTVMKLRHVVNGVARTELVETEASIGRGADCEIIIADSSISRRHARVYRENGDWWVADLDSTNGTFVNGERVSGPAPLSEGDVVRLDDHELEVDLEPDTAGVVFDRTDPEATGTIVASADVAALLREGTEQGATPRASGPSGASTTILEQSGRAEREARASEGGWLIDLFSQAAQALLAAEGTRETLEEIMRLVLDNVPAQRGAISLCREGSDDLDPVVVRGLERGDELRISRKIVRGAVDGHKAFLIGEVDADERFTAADTIVRMNIRSALCVPMEHDGDVQGLIYLDTRDPRHQFGKHDLRLVSALGLLGAIGIRQARYREDLARHARIRSRLERYSSPSVVERLEAVDEYDELLADERVITVLICDLHRFSALSEELDPTDTAELLNAMFERLTRVVFAHEGTLDKYTGDGMIVIFGAPFDQPDHAERAVITACEMLEELEELSALRSEQPPLQMRIGINTGRAVVGDIGSRRRRDYTAIGDTVNVASRLESGIARPGQVVISRSTYEQVRERVRCEKLDPVRVKNRRQLVEPFLVRGLR